MRARFGQPCRRQLHERGPCRERSRRVARGRRARVCWAVPALIVLVSGAGALPAFAQDLIPFTPSSSAGTLYIGSPAATPNDSDGITIGVRMSDTLIGRENAAPDGSALGGSDQTMVTGGAIVDVYPFSSGLRLSGGVRFGGSSGPTLSGPGAVTVGGATYPATVVTSPDGPGVNGPTPYVGVGYGTTLFDGTIDLSIDAGALTAVPGSNGLSINDRAGAGDPEVGDFLPMVGVSATYRF